MFTGPNDIILGLYKSLFSLSLSSRSSQNSAEIKHQCKNVTRYLNANIHIWHFAHALLMILDRGISSCGYFER